MTAPTELNYKSLAAGQLPSSKTALYTVPSSTQAMVKTIIIANNGGGTNTVDLYFTLLGGATEVHILSITLDAGDIAIIDDAGTFRTSDVISGKATNASQVDYAISGGEAT